MQNYFVKSQSDYAHQYFNVYIKKMLVFLIENIYVGFGNQVFQLSIGIPMGTNCTSSLADLFLHSCEAELIQKFVREKINIPVYRRRIIN